MKLNEEELYTFEHEKAKHMIDILNGEYADEMMDDLKNWRNGTGAQIVHDMLMGGDRRIMALGLLYIFFKEWCPAKAEELAMSEIDG